MRKNIELSKTSTNKIDAYCNSIPDINDDFRNAFFVLILNDVLRIKDCSETSIVNFYISSCKNLLTNVNDIYDEDFITKLKQETRSKLAQKYVPKKHFDNNIDIYFNDVKREYILNPQGESDDLEFTEENRDIFIKNNLKNAITFAKRYTKFGIPLDDLIQAANIGLLTAFDKFDTRRSKLRTNIINEIENSSLTSFTYNDVKSILLNNFKYSKLLDTTLKNIPENGFESKETFLDWVKANVKKATFTSVTGFWIMASIMQEIYKYGKQIRIPIQTKSKKKKQQDDEYIINDEYISNYDDELNESQTLTFLSLDSINPYTDDNYVDNMYNEISQNDDYIYENDSLEVKERNQMFKDILEHSFSKLPGDSLRIIKKKFGIGYPFPMSISEIAESENINQNKIKYIIKQSLAIIKDNILDEDKQSIIEALR